MNYVWNFLSDAAKAKLGELAMADKACNEVVTVANMPMTVFDMISAMQPVRCRRLELWRVSRSFCHGSII